MITKEQFCKVQDHALLRHYCTKEEVKRWCSQADKYGFASVCVNPCEVAVCKELLKGSKVGVGTVIGYPLGVNTTKTKIFEGLDAIDNGADELDFVINVSRFKEGDHDYAQNELTEFVNAVKAKKPDVIVKVIIERYFITDEELPIICNIIIASGADYIKEATGYAPGEGKCGVEDIRMIKEIVKDRIKIKSAFACGETLAEFVQAIELGADRVGGNCADVMLEKTPDSFWAKGD